MILFITAIIVLLTGALVMIFFGRKAWANVAGPLFAVFGSGLAASGSVSALGGDRWEWSLNQAGSAVSAIVPLHFAMDPLSAFFCMVTSLITGLAAVYGGKYLAGYAGKKHLGAAWSFYLILTASMLLVETAWNGMMFLIVWEIMSLSSFFLVIFEADDPKVLKSGWIYLVATHLATACLLVMFMIMGSGGSFGFDAVIVPPALRGLVFVLAVIGFGTKAGFFPFHVWLPEAHPAAPSHVSAVMSGVMIKAGIYGILRICVLSGGPDLWWGWLLVVTGAVTGVGGVLFALTQKDLKRLLAYSTVENVGIIAMGIGLGMIGVSTHHPVLTVLCFTGGLLHVLNHAVMKSLLFLGAGSVLHATGTRNIETLGGLMKRMGTSGTVFMLGSTAICALPPLNGFVSEFLIFLGSFRAFPGHYETSGVLAAGLVISALALIGGLAVACFTRATGIVFLGEPRSQVAEDAHESGFFMRMPMQILGLLCLVLGLSGPYLVRIIQPAVRILAGQSEAMSKGVALAAGYLGRISEIWLVLLGLVLGLMLIRKALLRKRPVHTGQTWDCGYSVPHCRMQYTGSSFSDPVVTMFQTVLRSEKRLTGLDGHFPAEARIETRTRDLFLHRVYAPVFFAVEWVAVKIHRIQPGNNQVYILYIVLALLSLLIWTFRGLG